MADKNNISDFNQINLFDFNLLFVFEAIFIFNSVTIAADNLGTSPSSVSQALNKLRTYFSDPLFVRKGQGLVPTTVAINLHAKISVSLGDLSNNIINHAEIGESDKFVIYCSSYTAQRVMPAMCAAINARNLPFELIHISADASLNAGEDILTYRKADIVFDTEPNYGYASETILYLRDKIIPVCRKEHPRLDRTLTRENSTKEKFARTNVHTMGMIRAQNTVDGHFHQRNFSFGSSSTEVNAAVCEMTDSICFVTEWFYEKFCHSYNLKKLECEFDIEPLSLYMTYNKTSLNNLRFVAFIDLIKYDILGHPEASK